MCFQTRADRTTIVYFTKMVNHFRRTLVGLDQPNWQIGGRKQKITALKKVSDFEQNTKNIFELLSMHEQVKIVDELSLLDPMIRWQS